LDGNVHTLFFYVFPGIKSALKGKYKGIKRDYEVEDVLKLRGSIDIEFVLLVE
jgi:hypothetical protein